MKNNIKQVIKYHSSGSRSMTIGKNRCVNISVEVVVSENKDVFITYASFDKDNNTLQEFINGDLVVEYFKPKADDSSL